MPFNLLSTKQNATTMTTNFYLTPRAVDNNFYLTVLLHLAGLGA